MNNRRLSLVKFRFMLGLVITIALLLFLSGSPTSTFADGPWYVKPGGNDGNDCLSPVTSCATIGGALGKASGGDTIYVAVGTYTPLGDGWMDIDKDITLSGGWDPDFTTQDGTSTIDGEGAGNRIGVGENVTAMIDRFTMQNDGSINNYGILTLTNSVLRDNTAPVGGGIWAGENSSTTIIDSQIYGNYAWEDGGGIYLFINSDLTLIRSWVVGNQAENGAGGIWVEDGGSAYIENSIVAGNLAYNGGGLEFWGSGPYTIVNSHIVGNVSRWGVGAAILGWYAEIVATNTLIISNTGGTGIDGLVNSIITLDYCDTYDNSPDGTGNVSIYRNDCLGTTPEDGLDPMMAGEELPEDAGINEAEDWIDYDYSLLPGSPAIDAGTPDGAPETDIAGTPRDVTPDLGAFEYENFELKYFRCRLSRIESLSHDHVCGLMKH